jgi:hypothetical protein
MRVQADAEWDHRIGRLNLQLPAVAHRPLNFAQPEKRAQLTRACLPCSLYQAYRVSAPPRWPKA